MKHILTVALLVFVLTTPFNEVFARSVDRDFYLFELDIFRMNNYAELYISFILWITVCFLLTWLYRPIDFVKKEDKERSRKITMLVVTSALAGAMFGSVIYSGILYLLLLIKILFHVDILSYIFETNLHILLFVASCHTAGVMYVLRYESDVIIRTKGMEIKYHDS